MKIVAQPVEFNVGVFQFVGRLLFMLRDNAKVSRVSANRLILGDRHHHRFRAVDAPALAGEIDRSGMGFDFVVRGDLGHTLVDFSEECLVPRETFLPSAHVGHCPTNALS